MTQTQTINEQHVMLLVEAALAGMQKQMDNSYTSAELFSAVLTLTGKVVHVMLARGADELSVRAAVEMVFPQPLAAVKVSDKRMN